MTEKKSLPTYVTSTTPIKQSFPHSASFQSNFLAPPLSVCTGPPPLQGLTCNPDSLYAFSLSGSSWRNLRFGLEFGQSVNELLRHAPACSAGVSRILTENKGKIRANHRQYLHWCAAQVSAAKKKCPKVRTKQVCNAVGVPFTDQMAIYAIGYLADVLACTLC